MLIGKQCYIRSLKRDFSEIISWAMFVIATIIGIYIGYVKRNEIVGIFGFVNSIFQFIYTILYAILYTHISSSNLSLAIILIVMVGLYISIARDDKETAKRTSCNMYILYGVLCIIASFMLMLVMVVCYGLSVNIPMPERYAYLNEMLFGIVVLLIVNVVVTPFVLGYTRCKGELDESEPVVAKGE